MKQLDLHNLRHEQVHDKVEDFILLTAQPCSIITGNSERMKEIVITVLKQHDMKYVIYAHNLGEIIVL